MFLLFTICFLIIHEVEHVALTVMVATLMALYKLLLPASVYQVCVVPVHTVGMNLRQWRLRRILGRYGVVWRLWIDLGLQAWIGRRIGALVLALLAVYGRCWRHGLFID